MRNKNEYRNLTVAQILALDNENTRDYLETLIREHTGPDDYASVTAQIAETLDEDDRNDAIQIAQDEDEYLTEALDRATDDALARVLTGMMGTGTSTEATDNQIHLAQLVRDALSDPTQTERVINILLERMNEKSQQTVLRRIQANEEDKEED